MFGSFQFQTEKKFLAETEEAYSIAFQIFPKQNIASGGFYLAKTVGAKGNFHGNKLPVFIADNGKFGFSRKISNVSFGRFRRKTEGFFPSRFYVAGV